MAIVLGFGAGLALGIVGCVQGVDDADKYGRITLPGTGKVELPEGTIALYYEEKVKLRNDDALDSPDGIAVVARRENTVVKSERRGVGNAVSLDNRALDEWGKLEIPTAGTYRVSARSKEPGSNDPAVTFGKGQTGNFIRAIATVGGGIGGGAVLGILIMGFGRIGYEPGVFRSKPGAPTEGGLAAPDAWREQQRVADPTRPSVLPWAHQRQQTPAADPPPGGDPLAAKLADLDRRRASGEITEEEYSRQRRELINEAF